MATDPIDGIYDEAAQEWNVHPALLRAIAGQESGGTRDPDRARSPAGAQGRMQLMPKTAIELGVTDTADPRQNIFAGAKYLSQMLDRYGRPDHALAAYNAGPGRVDDYLAGRGGLPNETRNYVPSVTQRYQALVGSQRQAKPQPEGDAVSNALGVPAGEPDTQPGAYATEVTGAPPSSATAGAYRQAVGAEAAGSTEAAPVSAYRQAIGAPLGATYTQPATGVAAIVAPLARDVGDTLHDAGQALGLIDRPAASPDPQPHGLTDRFGPVAGDAAAENLDAARKVNAAKTADQRVREALAPAPGTTYSDVLPIATDDKTGQPRLALPSSLRSVLAGGYDLSQGPATGTVTPAATEALAGVMMGGALNPSVARGTGQAIGSRLFGGGRNEADDYLGAAFRADPKFVAPPATTVPNPLVGASPAPVPNGLAGSAPLPNSLPIPGAPPSTANQLQFPSSPVKPAPVAPAPVPPVPQAAAVARPVANGLTGAPATDAPKPSLLPAFTRSGASSRVDDLLAHFSAGGNTSPQPNALAGAPSTLAQATGNAGIAALENGLRGTDPHFNNLYTAQARIRSQARNDAFQTIAGTSNDIEMAELAREAATAKARDAAFANPSPVDAKPVAETIASILASPDGKRDAVTRSLRPVMDKIQAAGGSGLETDPAQLYGVRKAINDQLSSVGTQEGSDAKTATRQLMQVRDALDGVIEQGAPGFSNYIKQYSDASRPIDAMRWLQSQNVTDQLGNIQLGKLDSAVKRLQAQRAKPGSGLADSVTSEHIDALTLLRDDMRREAAINATKPIGSNTAQNLATDRLTGALSAVKGPVDGAALAGAVLAPGIGTIAGLAGRLGMNKLAGRGSEMVQQELRARLLNPLTGTPTPGANGLAGTPRP